jgi:hypothetical protein
MVLKAIIVYRTKIDQHVQSILSIVKLLNDFLNK